MAGVFLIAAALAAGAVLALLVFIAASIRHEGSASELGCPGRRGDARVRQLTGLYVRRGTTCTAIALHPETNAADTPVGAGRSGPGADGPGLVAACHT